MRPVVACKAYVVCIAAASERHASPRRNGTKEFSRCSPQAPVSVDACPRERVEDGAAMPKKPTCCARSWVLREHAFGMKCFVCDLHLQRAEIMRLARDEGGKKSPSH